MNSSNETIEKIEPQVRALLVEHARLSSDALTLGSGADLFQAGMTSHSSVNVLLALEQHFDMEFPDSMLQRSAFSSIDEICRAVAKLSPG